jgi:hypothetical protein
LRRVLSIRQRAAQSGRQRRALANFASALGSNGRFSSFEREIFTHSSPV